ncbi:hypothetical protein ACFYXS_28000 [Streptomyces sp. NPDC002574]|uniref:hypothetical protein n=1 Tax=Streptomyces sp. NPDC002574 TaxID=3364652 RepID=UPI0036B49C07
MALMTRCEEQPDREPVLLADAVATVLDGIGFGSRGEIPAQVPAPDPAAGTATTCARCGSAAVSHRTTGGRRIGHADVCPAGPPPAASPVPLARWRRRGTGHSLS